MKIILTILGIILTVTLITIWSSNHDKKLVEAYDNTEPCMFNSNLPACE